MRKELPMKLQNVSVRRALLSVVTSLAISATALAHHSGAMFDHQKVVTLHGTVKTFEWTSPHVWVFLVVTGSDGDQTWAIESNDPSAMSRIGWNHRALNVGDAVSIDINPRKDGQLSGFLRQVVFADGRVLSGGEPPATFSSSPR